MILPPLVFPALGLGEYLKDPQMHLTHLVPLSMTAKCVVPNIRLQVASSKYNQSDIRTSEDDFSSRIIKQIANTLKPQLNITFSPTII